MAWKARTRGEGTLYFANGGYVSGAWLFPVSFGFVPSRLRLALRNQATKEKIIGRSNVVRFDCTVEYATDEEVVDNPPSDR